MYIVNKLCTLHQVLVKYVCFATLKLKFYPLVKDEVVEKMHVPCLLKEVLISVGQSLVRFLRNWTLILGICKLWLTVHRFSMVLDK